jgi:hypothetical protein
VSRATLERRLDEITAQIEAIRPSGSDLTWAEYTTDEELRWLVLTYRRVADFNEEPSDAERLRALGIYATAMGRMVEVVRP